MILSDMTCPKCKDKVDLFINGIEFSNASKEDELNNYKNIKFNVKCPMCDNNMTLYILAQFITYKFEED